MQLHPSWIWQQKEWPEFYYDSGILLPQISTISRLIGGLEAICHTLSDVERLYAQERVLADDAMETAAIEGETRTPTRIPPLDPESHLVFFVTS